MALDVQGIINSINTTGETTTAIVPYLREVFVNETPMFSRLPHEPIGNPEYNIDTYDVRSRNITLAAAITAVSQFTVSTVQFTDVSQMQVGDVLEVYNTANSAYERMEVQADPNVAAGTVSVLRGVEGTTPVANDTTNPGSYIVGNSRTGAEVSQTAFRSVRTLIPQYVQTYQEAVQIGGLVQAIQNIALPPGINDVMSLEKATKMTEFVRDVEYTSMYGLGNGANASNQTRRRQKGVRAQTAAANVKLNAGASYTKLNFVADTVTKCLNGGGNPDTIICSVNFATVGLSTWSFGQQNFMDPKKTPYLGVAIEEFLTSALGQPMKVITSFQMRPGTAFVCTWKDLKFRRIREAFYQMRGVRGDAWEADYIGDYCIEIGHPGWHAWVEGITSYA